MVPATAIGQVEQAVQDSIKFRGQLPEVVVRAPRPVTAVGGAAAIEADVDSLPLPAAPSIEEVLREIPLMHIRTNSRGETEVTTRGSESRQVAVLVDGIPITLAWDARADVSVIPATALQSITFVRGLSSMLHGPNVLGGVVEARIAGATEPPEAASALVTIGTDDVGAYGASASGTLPLESSAGAFQLRGGLAFRDSPGDPLANDLREPVPGDDEDLRLNTDAENVSGFVAGRFVSEGGAWASFSGSSFKEARGIAAELGLPDEDARLWRYPHVSRTLAVLSGGTGFRSSPFGGEGDLEASIGFDRGRTDIDAYTSRDYSEIESFEDAEDRTLTMRLLADQTLSERGDLRAAFTLADIHHDESLSEDGDAEYQQRLWSMAAENNWRLLDGGERLNALSLSVGGAYDVAETPKTGGRPALGQLSEWGGRFGLSAVMHKGRTVLHAGVSRRGRFPALRELYSGALGRFEPNPDLEPEKLITTEAGVTRQLRRGEVQLVGFHTELEDAVVRISLNEFEGDRRQKRVNQNKVTSTGVELVGSYALGRLVLTGDATLQSVELSEAEGLEKHEPENMPEAFGSLGAQFPVFDRTYLGTSVAYKGRQFAIDGITGEDARLDGETVVDAYLSRTWPFRATRTGRIFTQVETRLSVDNIGDVALYDSWGLPEPGRRIRLELRIQ
jgi:iron complex outermembrane receptor protein